ncbi:hemagglutinin repeat-containing protein [Glaesserella parasuis]|nr:hemagglutinin repeat-containing protein [Glaesserella parasuis]
MNELNNSGVIPVAKRDLTHIQAVDSTMKSAKSVGSSKNSRVNAMAAANVGFEALRAAEQLQGVADAVSNGSATGGAVGVSITYGQQKTEQTQHSEGNTAEKSQVNAGGNVTITAQGKGEQSHLTIEGADVSGQGGTHLKADGDVNILAADENHLERSKNKSSGFNVGVAIQIGGGLSAGITAGGNVAKGYGNGESQAWVASQVGSENSKTTIESGKDTNVIGSQVKGKRVEVSAENLNIESLQDTARYEGKQESVSGQVTVGYGASAGGSYSKSKVNSNYASVKTQAGIYAGDEGYDIHIKEHTELTGGLVTSTDKAETEGKNRFSTGTLNATDIENHADYKGSGISVSGSVAMNFDTPLGNRENGIAQSNKQAVNEKGEKIYLDSQGNETTEAKTGGQANQAKLATGLASLTGGVNIGYGSDGDSQRSRTKSGINTANIDIRDSQAQQTKTGKTVEEIRAQVKTEIHTDNAESHSGKLENRFDKAAVQNELDYQVKVLQEFDKNRKEVTDYFYKKAEENRAEAVEIRKTTEINGKTGYNTEVSLELERKADIYDSIALGTDLVLGATYGWGNSNLLNYAGIGAVTTPVVNVATAPEQIWVTTCQQDSLYCADNNMDGSKRPTESGKVQIGDKRQIFDITEIKPSETSGVITLSNNGILNPLDDALKNAIKQNKWETNKEGIVVVYNRPTGNYVSELLYAAYDKTNDLLGGRLPLTTAEKANLKLYGYAKQNNYALDISSHSRGGLTASVALQEANRIGLNNIPIRESRFFGTATNVKDYAGYLKENNPNAVVKSAVHYTDFVGRSPLVAFRSKYIVGGNEPTGGVENTWFTYSHSSYFAERPSEYLINEKGQYIDLKGNRIDEKNKIENEYLKEFNTIWAPIDKQSNPSLPEVINSKQGDK